MKEKIIIIGISKTAGFAYNTIKEYDLYDVIGFAVNRQYKTLDNYYGLPVYEVEELSNEFETTEVKVFVALLWNHLNGDRRRLYEAIKNMGFQCGNILSPRASIHIDVSKLENVWIHDFAVIQHRARIGNDVAIMGGVLVGNGTVIEDHCFLGAHSTVAGGCHIGEQSFVGIHCVVFDETTVGKKCILGACTAVKRNVPDFSVWKSSSADIQIQQYTEEEIEKKLQFRLNVR